MKAIPVTNTDPRLFQEWPATSAGYESSPGEAPLLVVGPEAPDASVEALAARFAVPARSLIAFRDGQRAA